MRQLRFRLLLPIVLIAGASSTLTAADFVRGDVNADGSFNIADAVSGLSYLFGGGPLGCADALDSNDDGATNIADPILILSALFSAGPSPAAPFPACGPDPTLDGLDCATFDACGACVPDTFEPNDSQSSCVNLGVIPDSGAFPAGTFADNFHTSGDEDWFCYEITDEVFGVMEPRIVVSDIPAGMSVEIFIIWTCITGGLSGVQVVSSSGAASVTASPTFECGLGMDDSLEIQFCVSQISGPESCEYVTVAWGDGG
ncbi:MAG: dockerin type I repeat-containing protein [Planctomycetota bacterium]